MKIVCISDTHMSHEDVVIPAGDILIHAGDFTCTGSLKEVAGFCNWFATLPHPHKILVAGNHDWLFQREPEIAKMMVQSFHYLEDSEVTIKGLRIWGSPWTPEFNDWAFNLPRGERLRQRWAQIPEGVDILVTHGPPYGVLDRGPDGAPLGCPDLGARVVAVQPLLHVFGHVHHGYGRVLFGNTEIVNASVCNEEYAAVNKPVVVEI